MTEILVVGLPGPTHNYGGLSYGNEASMENEAETSNPQKAALQSLAKMKFLNDLGVKCVVMPIQERPFFPILRRIGFEGSKEILLDQAKKKAPWIFKYISSSAFMWTANAATVSPSIDTSTRKVQFTAANLQNGLHRFIESETTSQNLKRIFSNPVFFEHHSPLPNHSHFADEGAANHLRFSKFQLGADTPGIHVFVYGVNPETDREVKPQKYPARQSKLASEAIARQHKLFDKQVLFVQQSPKAIDAGAFHNDVISMGHLNLFIYHEYAFQNPNKFLKNLENKVSSYCDTNLNSIKVLESELPLEDAISSYFFNSQIINQPDGSFILIAPSNCLEVPKAKAYIEEMISRSDNPLASVHYMDLKQSMKNGGGPACLRLRAVVNNNEYSAINQNFILNETLYQSLVSFVKRFYRDELKPNDIFDPQLWKEEEAAREELKNLLKY